MEPKLGDDACMVYASYMCLFNISNECMVGVNDSESVMHGVKVLVKINSIFFLIWGLRLQRTKFVTVTLLLNYISKFLSFCASYMPSLITQYRTPGAWVALHSCVKSNSSRAAWAG